MYLIRCSISLFIFIVALSFTPKAIGEENASKPSVLFVVPDKKGPIFWQLVLDVGISASKSLNINFSHIYTNSDRFAIYNAIYSVLESENKPDYIIFRPFKGASERIYKLLEKHKIKFITIERAFDGEEAKRLGKPQEQFSHWIGQINYDNQRGGQLLSDALIQAHANSRSEPANIVALGGDFDFVSMQRQNYIEHYNVSHKTNRVNVLQVFPMYWNPVLVRERLPAIVERYPETNIVWTAGDQMAFEVIDYYKRFGLSLPIVGGFDWLPETFNRIERGQMTASVGGHFLVVAQALLKTVDYHKGLDRFIGEDRLYQYELVTKDNVNSIKQFIQESGWKKTDFTQYLHSNSSKKVKTLTIQNLIADYTR